MASQVRVLLAAVALTAGCGGEEEIDALPAPSGTFVPPAAPTVPEFPSVPGAWTQQASGTGEDFTAIAALDENRAWVADATGHSYRTQNGGATWSPWGSLPLVRTTAIAPHIFTPLKVTRLQFVDELHGWALGPHGVASTSNGGGTWTLQLDYWKPLYRALSFTSPTTGWVTSAGYYGGGSTSHTADGGETWTFLEMAGSELVSGQAIKFVDSQTGWLAAKSQLFKTVDQGQTWQSHAPLDQWSFLMDLSAVDDTHAWVLANEHVFGTVDGHAWRVQHLDGSRRLQFVDTSRGWVVGAKIHHTSDGCATWTVQTTPQTDFNGVAFVNASTGWIVGDNGLILKTETGGK